MSASTLNPQPRRDERVSRPTRRMALNSRVPVNLSRYAGRLDRLDPVRMNGRVAQVIGLVIESTGPPAMIGEICMIKPDRNRLPVAAEVVGFKDGSSGTR